MQPTLTMTFQNNSNSTSIDSLHPETERLQTERKGNGTRAKYHRRALLLLVLYVPLITVPWVLTCVLSRRPIGVSTYHFQRGFTDKQMRRFENWTTAINVLNSISGLITVPILSALVAQAAVVYSESHLSRKDFRLEHLVALADRVWTNPVVLGKTWEWKGRQPIHVRNLLHFAAVVIVLGGLKQPLYQIVAPMQSMLVPTCRDTYPRSYTEGFYVHDACQYNPVGPKHLGWDLEPVQMAKMYMDNVVQQLIGEMATVSVKDGQPHLWANKSTAQPADQTLRDLNRESFVASLAQGTSTGVLRDHIMRLNSSVSCERIPRSEFPSSCAGERPFTVAFEHGGNFTKVCVPGVWGTSPWTLSRSRQDIHEDLYLDMLEQLDINPGTIDERNYTTDCTLHCRSTTTRGFFELGNYRNNHTWGPLLERWLDAEDLAENYNDFSPTGLPVDDSAAPPKNLQGPKYVPGPLTTVATALFGNNTFFDIAKKAWNNSDSQRPGGFTWDQVCTFLPFAQFNPRNNLDVFADTDRFPPCKMNGYEHRVDNTWEETLAEWLHGFNDTEMATQALSTAVFLANRLVVTADKWNGKYEGYGALSSGQGRTIYSGTGTIIRKPGVSIAWMAVVSSILFVELVALGLLTWLIYRSPSSTESLDVITFSRLKKEMEDR